MLDLDLAPIALCSIPCQRIRTVHAFNVAPPLILLPRMASLSLRNRRYHAFSDSRAAGGLVSDQAARHRGRLYTFPRLGQPVCPDADLGEVAHS